MHIMYFIHCSIRKLRLKCFRILNVEQETVGQLFLLINKMNHHIKFLSVS